MTRFSVRSEVLAKYPVRDAGGSGHSEHWIPAEDLDVFNRAIVGRIEVGHAFGR